MACSRCCHGQDTTADVRRSPRRRGARHRHGADDRHTRTGRHHRRSDPALQAGRDLRHGCPGLLRSEPRRHGQRHRRLGGRPGAGLQRLQHLRQDAGQHHGRPELDHRRLRHVDRSDHGQALLPVRDGQQERHRRQRLRLPVHHRQRVPHRDHAEHLRQRAEHPPVGHDVPAGARHVEAHHVHPDRHHRRPVRERRGEGPQHQRDHHPRLDRRRDDRRELHRPVAVRQRQVLQGPDAGLPPLQPGAVPLRGADERLRHRAGVPTTARSRPSRTPTTDR